MKLSHASNSRRGAFTLVEMTLVILILMILIAVGFQVANMSKTTRLGRQASEALRTVYTAQRLFLADNPATPVTSLTNALLIPYLPNRATTMPTVESLTGSTLTIKVTTFPPVVDSGGGVTYDPSGNSKDSLWDVGE